MEIHQIIFLILLLIGFVCCILPTTKKGEEFINKIQIKQKKDLEKWRKRQHRNYQIERHQRLH